MNTPLGRLEKIRHDFLFQEPINWAGYYAACMLVALHFENQESFDHYMSRLEEASNGVPLSSM